MAKLSQEALAMALNFDENQKQQQELRTSVNEKRMREASPGSWTTVYDDNGTHRAVWKSAIVGGDELQPAGVYILQRTSAKSPSEFKLGHQYRALSTTDGEFSGEVVDEAFHTFVVDAGDLFTTY